MRPHKSALLKSHAKFWVGLLADCDSEDKMLIICDVTSHDHMLKGLSEFKGRNSIW